jgi:CBS domain containing-hemolysin-like protein
MTDSTRDPENSQPKPGLFERLRHALGLAPGSLRDDLEDALEQSDTEDDLSAHERAILRNVLELHEHRVEDIMIPRADIVAVAITSTLAEVLAVFRTAGHSRLPVHGETLDDPRGMVHIRDFVDHVARATEGGLARRRSAGATEPEKPTTPTDRPAARPAQKLGALGALDLSTPLSEAGIIRPVLFVPPSMPALDLLVKMQATRTHMALVIDEYGGTDGLVSIEDVVEMIVGDIEDEHDLDEEPRIDRINDREFLVDARADLGTVAEKTGADLVKSIASGEIETLAGLITSVLGRVPARGEIVRSDDPELEYEIVDADPRRIKRVRIRLTKSDSAQAGTEHASRVSDQADRSG